MLAAQGIATGDIEIAVAGGMESMSNAPYLLHGRARRAAHGPRPADRLDDQRRPVVLVRAVPHGQRRRGRRRPNTTSAAASRTSTRSTAIARRPRRPPRAASRRRSCRWPIPQKKGDADRRSTATNRSAPTRRVEALGALKPAFKKDGTVTAGNAPPVNDGAAALVVMSAARASALERDSRWRASSARRRAAWRRSTC